MVERKEVIYINMMKNIITMIIHSLRWSSLRTVCIPSDWMTFLCCSSASTDLLNCLVFFCCEVMAICLSSISIVLFLGFLHLPACLYVFGIGSSAHLLGCFSGSCQYRYWSDRRCNRSCIADCSHFWPFWQWEGWEILIPFHS